VLTIDFAEIDTEAEGSEFQLRAPMCVRRGGRFGSVLFVIFSAIMLVMVGVGGAHHQILPIATNLFVGFFAYALVGKELRKRVSRSQILLSPLLLYTVVSLLFARLFNPELSTDVAANVATNTLFHTIKDVGIGAVQSLYLVLMVPFASLLSQEIFRGLNTLYDFLLLGQVKRGKPFSTTEKHTRLQDSLSGFWSGFARGFVGEAKGLVLVRYLMIVYSLAFLSIPLLSYLMIEPAMPQVIPEPWFPYWAFMDTFVAGAVWALYTNRVSGIPQLEKFFLQIFYSFFTISALATLLSPRRPEYIIVTLPPIKLIGIVICMLSLREQVLKMAKLSTFTKLLLFVVGAIMYVVPSAVLTISPWANYDLWVIYLWSTSSVGLAIWAYLVSCGAKVKHGLLASVLTFVCFETTFMARFLGLALHVADFVTAWCIVIGIGLLAALFLRRFELISFSLLATAWIVNELLFQNWLYLLILAQVLAIGTHVRAENS